jgi:wobble nucleotide-excising tRNase
MLSKITMNSIASYKRTTELITDKKVNLIYGLNGTGKSTLSNYLYNINQTEYINCSIEGLSDNHEFLVYNTSFVRDNFYESENLNGIFTLSKENKEAKVAVDNAEKELRKIEEEKNKKVKEREKLVIERSQKETNTKDKIWEIKRDYSGGDRVLEFCLEGFKSKKDLLFDYLLGIERPKDKPERTIEDLKKEVQILDNKDSKYDEFEKIEFSAQYVEKEVILQKQIVGNKNSSVSDLIIALGNSDWVKEGLKYIKSDRELEHCPFCQSKTITNELLMNIKNYFDEMYDNDITEIDKLSKCYRTAFDNLPNKTILDNCPVAFEFSKDFEIRYEKLTNILQINLNLMKDKIQYPSLPIILSPSDQILNELNDIIKKVNNIIKLHNIKIENKVSELKKIKDVFWSIMRWEYDQTITCYMSEKKGLTDKINNIDTNMKYLNVSTDGQMKIISEQQKKTVNIDEAISNINSGLLDLGIDDIKIRNHVGKDALYEIVRCEANSNIFKTLSEGEKMVISFLYFIELCKGKKKASDSDKKKIIVIDDPISSLSHIYVFNIGRLIQNEFLRSDKYEQIFVLTHSLYFFYELTDMKKDRRDDNQKLFRLTKNNGGSSIVDMKYEEIQNDYQAYWYIIKDNMQPPALIANCMRNIIEYFFNFVEKKDLNNLFQKPELKEHRFESFNRYINRESHSLGQNIFDLKEFNYEDFRDAFALVFKVTKYEDHYKKMMR